MSAQAYWAATGASAALAVGAGLAEWARARRSNLDRVGWMPWQLISMMAIFATIVLAALAVHA